MPSPWWHIRHRSAYTYLAWAGLYLLLGFWQWLGGSVPVVFGQNLAADIVINIASPWVLSGLVTIATLAESRFLGFSGWAWPFFAITCVLTIVLPGLWIFKMGGWGTLLGAALFFTRANWFILRRQQDVSLVLLFARGIFGMFAFFAPALVITCLVLGRNTLGLHNTDWVPLFGVIYFVAQAAFEELMLRRVAARSFPSLP
ncbi:MAG: hypothetical protein MUF78_08880 [Candidatus Edwardsbacteria bacterium]|jgi:hypothetical protein|nr:hypothetical protein [Candidatus Edwardsbacteria bacterium]